MSDYDYGNIDATLMKWDENAGNVLLNAGNEWDSWEFGTPYRIIFQMNQHPIYSINFNSPTSDSVNSFGFENGLKEMVQVMSICRIILTTWLMLRLLLVVHPFFLLPFFFLFFQTRNSRFRIMIYNRLIVMAIANHRNGMLFSQASSFAKIALRSTVTYWIPMTWKGNQFGCVQTIFIHVVFEYRFWNRLVAPHGFTESVAIDWCMCVWESVPHPIVILGEHLISRLMLVRLSKW